MLDQKQLDQIEADCKANGIVITAITPVASNAEAVLAAKDAEIRFLKRELAEAELLSMANVGAAPISSVVNIAADHVSPTGNAAVLAHWRTLKGEARAA